MAYPEDNDVRAMMGTEAKRLGEEPEREGGITRQLRRAGEASQGLDEVLGVLEKRIAPILTRDLEGGNEEKGEADSNGAASGVAENVEFLANRLERMIKRVRAILEKVDL